MGSRLDEITPELASFIGRQAVFFVGSAPLMAGGHVNVSPKGLDTLRVLGPGRIAYLDLTGSGNETASHIAENGRLTIMFCAFEGRPRIVRVYCRARVVSRESVEWGELRPEFPEHIGERQIIVGDVEFVMTSCGYAVPRMNLLSERDTLRKWTEAKTPDELVAYRQVKNSRSLDGIEAPATD